MEVVASRSTAIDSQHTKETEVRLTAFFVLTNGANAALKQMQSLAFSCEKEILSYEYTCSGKRDDFTYLPGQATVGVSADGTTLTLQNTAQLFPGTWNEDGDHVFDATGRLDHLVNQGNAYTELTSVRGNGGLTVDLQYHWFPPANQCRVAPRTNIECIGVLVTP